MPMRETDWIVSRESWTYSEAGGYDVLVINTGSVLSLTSPRAVGVDSVRPHQVAATLEVADEWTLERIRGRIHYQLLVPGTLTSWRAIYDAWLIVLDADPATGLPFTAVNLDMTNNIWANRSILWHGSALFQQDSTWTDIAINQTPYSGTFEVDVKSKRRVNSSQVVGLVQQWTADNAADTDPPDLESVNRLRILGSL